MSVEHYNSVICFDVDSGLKCYAGITTYYTPSFYCSYIIFQKPFKVHTRSTKLKTNELFFLSLVDPH